MLVGITTRAHQLDVAEKRTRHEALDDPSDERPVPSNRVEVSVSVRVGEVARRILGGLGAELWWLVLLGEPGVDDGDDRLEGPLLERSRRGALRGGDCR